MQIKDALLAELEQEAGATRRVLEQIPEEKLDWRPHEKSMSLGQLAFHVARIPGGISALLAGETLDVSEANFTTPQPGSRAEILSALDEGISAAKDVLGGLDDARAASTWTLTRGSETLLSMPKVSLARSLLLNHWYHHRGQLTVYLRLLNIPVPAVYGRSADEDPLGIER
ncbi:MAG: hypothetical protein D6743_07715 [Calditrichaeota bacterium]|nr:MAG: hypothetical protein D6743_07715 [Calditrichota bacterium]